MLLAFSAMVNRADAQFWFQTGAFGSAEAEFNNGAAVSIQTLWQNVSDGSFGFWVGEELNNNAFIQVGYQIVNATGYYPTYCDQNGCTGSDLLTAGKPTWFWEYFPENYNGNSFYGGIGSDGSVGANGTFNMYSFRSNGNLWTVYFNNDSIGSVDLGTSESGTNPPSAIAELADSDGRMQPMQAVVFKNLGFYSGTDFNMAPKGFAYISYGKGSDMTIPNPYGVKEVDNFVDRFEVGSGLPMQNRSTLWNIGYQLRVVSSYGNMSSVENYSAFSMVQLNAPRVVNISNGTRAVFDGWVGSGQGSYTGSSAATMIRMTGSITETAMWKVQYYISINSTYTAYGSGWYGSNSTATLYVSPAVMDMDNGTRIVFEQWSNGAKTNSTKVLADMPRTLTAVWARQYLVNATTPYGTVQGIGWYDENSLAVLQLNETTIPVNPTTQIRFYGWSNGYQNSTIDLIVNSPVTISALYKRQFLMNLNLENAYGNPINGAQYYNIDRMNTSSSSVYLFENGSYVIDYIYYKGVKMQLNHEFAVNAPGVVSFEAPLYDVRISAEGILGAPLNASINMTFDNGTQLVSYLGDSGSIDLTNVPYGHAFGYVSYAGLNRAIVLYGGQIKVQFVTPTLIALIIAGIVVVVISAKFVRRRYPTKKS